MFQINQKIIVIVIYFVVLAMLYCVPVPKPASSNEGFSNISIITDSSSVRKFLEYEGFAFDSLWAPQGKDLSDVFESLDDYLGQRLKNDSGDLAKNSLPYLRFIKKSLRTYHTEFTGIYLNNNKFLFCNMLILGKTDDNNIKRKNGFTEVDDGGPAVVRFLYDIHLKKITRIEWNGEA